MMLRSVPCSLLLCAALLLFPVDVVAEGLTKSPSEEGRNSSCNCECPNQVYDPVNNIQISSFESPSTDPDQKCSINCSSCDKLLPLAMTQLALTNQILERLDEIEDSQPKPVGPQPPKNTHRPRDCAEVKAGGFNDSGRYPIYPADDEDPFFVFCDMDTSGGGWTVFQRRRDGSLDFFLNWLDYKYGFGSVESEHWLGNEKIHRLTSQKLYKLRVDLEDFEGETAYAEYNEFVVADEGLQYQLLVGGYQGTAGDSLAIHDGWRFSTKDRDHDGDIYNCALTFKGAWWYNACHESNLNGLYLRGANTAFGEGVQWKAWREWEYSLKTTEMKLFPLA